MVREKKGFDRIVYAFTNVLTGSLAWLFKDLQTGEKETTPLKAHHPQNFVSPPTITSTDDVIVPITRSKEIIANPTYQEELLEWLALVLMGSPRIHSDEKIDSYLCRYQLPDAFAASQQEDATPQNIVHVRWQGLIPSKFVTEMLLVVKVAQGKKWMSLAASDFEGKTYTVLCLDEREVLSWECD
jgi:ribonuclease P/MRP protein subunit RPP40